MDRRDTIALYSHVNMAPRVPTGLVGRQMQQDEIHQGREAGSTVYQPEGPHQGDKHSQSSDGVYASLAPNGNSGLENKVAPNSQCQ